MVQGGEEKGCAIDNRKDLGEGVGGYIIKGHRNRVGKRHSTLSQGIARLTFLWWTLV